MMKMNELKAEVPYEKRLKELDEKSHELFHEIYEIENEINRLGSKKLSLWKERKAVVEEIGEILEKYNLDEYGKPKVA